jgi:hypothetical protein
MWRHSRSVCHLWRAILWFAISDHDVAHYFHNRNFHFQVPLSLTWQTPQHEISWKTFLWANTRRAMKFWSLTVLLPGRTMEWMRCLIAKNKMQRISCSVANRWNLSPAFNADFRQPESSGITPIDVKSTHVRPTFGTRHVIDWYAYPRAERNLEGRREV